MIKTRIYNTSWNDFFINPWNQENVIFLFEGFLNKIYFLSIASRPYEQGFDF